MLKNFFFIFSFIITFNVNADVITLNENAPKTYVVKKGDTLWDISGLFLKQPWLWPKLWRFNPEIDNPHLIYPGDKLRLVFDAEGQPMLVKGKTELKWSPKVRKTHKEQNPISTIPLEIIEPFIKYDTVLSAEKIASAPVVLGSDEGYKSSLDGFHLYVNDNLILMKSYAIYYQGDEIFDPETNKSLGFHANLAGSGKVIRQGDMDNDVPATLYLESAKQELRSGAIVLPVNEGQMLPSYFAMQAVNKKVNGRIIKSTRNIREFGKLEVIMINKGKNDSINEGDVFTIKRTSPSVLMTSEGPVYTKESSMWSRLASHSESDYKMPIEVIGQTMVFKAYNDLSLALVLKTTKPARLNDAVTAP